MLAKPVDGTEWVYYRSIGDATDAIKGDRHEVSNICKGIRKTPTKGYVFKFAEDHNG